MARKQGPAAPFRPGAPARRTGATIHDVARATGVSSMTVSRVVNGGAGVGAELRQRVEAMLRELNYVPNLAARAARAGTLKVGVLLSNPRSSNLGEFLMGAFTSAARLGCQMVVEPVTGPETDAVRRIVDLGVDGLVLPPPLCDSLAVREVLWTARLPMLGFATADPRPHSSSVSIDDFAGAQAATRHLLALGHRRIAFVRGDAGHSTARSREEGYRAAMAEQLAPAADDLLADGDFSYRSGLAAGRGLLERPAGSRPTAIVASSDDMAAAIVAVAHGLDLRVPAELSVVGFDDTPIAATVWPPLTTVHQPIAQMASAAIEMVADTIRRVRAGEAEVVEHRRCAFELVVRSSTAPPPADGTS